MSYSTQETNWAMFCHLGSFCGYFIPLGNIIVPLVLWLVKRDEWPYVNQHGKEALNFNISFTIYAIISAVLCIVLIGFVLLAALFIMSIVFVIQATLSASKGEYYRYPLIFRFIR